MQFEQLPGRQPVFAVKFNRRYRVDLPLGSMIVTALPVDGSNVYPAEATIVENDERSVLR